MSKAFTTSKAQDEAVNALLLAFHRDMLNMSETSTLEVKMKARAYPGVVFVITMHTEREEEPK